MDTVIKRVNEYERIVFAEVLIPDTLNVYGDFHTKESVKEFAYGFMKQGFGFEVEHNEIDRTGDLLVVESFIARAGDPDFIEGAWVVATYVADDELWDGILDGRYNGYSYTALVNYLDIDMVMPIDKIRVGTTEADLNDGHAHDFVVVLDDDGRVIAGGTNEVDGHMHAIRSHTFTEYASGHIHIYNFIQGSEGL